MSESPDFHLLDLKLQWLACFVAVVRCGSLRAAAEELQLSEQSIRNYLQALEKYFQGKLLLIQPHQVTLVGKGQDLFIRARMVLEKISALTQAQSAAQMPLPRLRLGGHLNICPELVARSVRQLQGEQAFYPELKLISGVNARARVESALTTREIDLGIAIAQPQNPLVAYYPGPVIPMLIVTSQPDRQPWESLRYAIRPSLYEPRGLPLRIRLLSQIDHLNLLLCARGETAGIFAENQVRLLLEAGLLHSAAAHPDQLGVQLYLLWRAQEPLPEPAQRFAQIFQQHGEAYAATV